MAGGEPGSRCDKTVCLTDLLATVAGICDVDLPRDAGEDSYDILPYMQGDQFVHHSISGFAIRKDQWKLVTCRLFAGAICDGMIQICEKSEGLRGRIV